MKIKCIVVEDEPLAMERTTSYVSKIPVLELLHTFDNAMDAYSFLQSNVVDLIFLDINLGELSGIQLLESVKIKSQVIITTAYPEYALKGYDLNVTDYLLKPFLFDRFFQAVDKVVQQASNNSLSNSRDFIFVKTENKLEKVLLNDILFIEGMRDYRRIHTVAKKIMTLQTFTELEKELPPHLICRIHKSWMVAISKINSVEKDVVNVNGIEIPVSETYKKQFYELIKK
ncbi:MAG: response regulator transcription factor [Chitinophagaceae bacterium]|nr:MAG: response regulator transcription factor [Chitinophagaceae bacterium]